MEGITFDYGDDNKGLLQYDANNSGGHWWLKTEDFVALEKAGWVVHWYHDVKQKHEAYDVPAEPDKNDPHIWQDLDLNPKGYSSDHSHKYGTYPLPLVKATSDGTKYLGDALATSAAKRFKTAREGVEEWQRLTGADPSEEGCNCCGVPHTFEWDGDDGKHQYITSYTESRRMSYED